MPTKSNKFKADSALNSGFSYHSASVFLHSLYG